VKNRICLIASFKVCEIKNTAEILDPHVIEEATTTKMIYSNAPFFPGVDQNISRSYKRSGVTVAVDPLLEMHL
jgi:hypothetical protein